MEILTGGAVITYLSETYFCVCSTGIRTEKCFRKSPNGSMIGRGVTTNQ